MIIGRHSESQGNKSTPVRFYWRINAIKVKNRVFVKLDSRYADYFTEYLNYSGRSLRLLKSMYGMTNSGGYFLMS